MLYIYGAPQVRRGDARRSVKSRVAFISLVKETIVNVGVKKQNLPPRIDVGAALLRFHFHFLTFPGRESAAQRPPDRLRCLPPGAVRPPGATARLQDLPEPPDAVLQR